MMSIVSDTSQLLRRAEDNGPVLSQGVYELFSSLCFRSNYLEASEELLLVEVMIVLDSITQVKYDWLAQHLLVSRTATCLTQKSDFKRRLSDVQ